MRAAHSKYGKYAVYPGGQFKTQLIPFVEGGLKLNGKTKTPSAVMSSYSIAWSDDGSLGEKVGSAFSEYKIGLLRNIFQLGLFENPYLDVAKTVREVGNPQDKAAGYEAQLKSIVLLKNKGGVIHKAAAQTQKPIVYVPMIYRPVIENKTFHTRHPDGTI